MARFLAPPPFLLFCCTRTRGERPFTFKRLESGHAGLAGKMSSWQQQILVYVKKSKFLRLGLPFISFMVLGSFGLAEFTEIRVRKRDQKTHMLTAEETLQFQKKVKSVDAEEELERTLKKLDIDHWVNKRVPRPPGWED